MQGMTNELCLQLQAWKLIGGDLQRQTLVENALEKLIVDRTTAISKDMEKL